MLLHSNKVISISRTSLHELKLSEAFSSVYYVQTARIRSMEMGRAWFRFLRKGDLWAM